ncbi:MAG: putative peptidoglycan glycosyltransferase FtsW [Brachybacterium sp.]|nr:putative peptidoglycan glycosyltransferase FtsW [Brachybacterium sp.]
MTLQQDRPTTRRPPRVLDSRDQDAISDVRDRVSGGLATWLASPALNFYGLIVVGLLLVGTGVVMVLSSSAVANVARGGSGYGGLYSQGVFAAVGLALAVTAACLPVGFYRKAAWLLLAIGLVLQSLILTPLGFGAGGNLAWVRIGPISFQPAEMLKLALAVWLGMVLARKRHLLSQPFHVLIPLAPVAIAALGLVMLGHDLGTMMIMAMLIGGAMWVAGLPRRWFLGAVGAGLVGIVFFVVTSSNRMRRIEDWFHGTCAGDNCLQSDRGLQALASGGWWGVGLGESRLKWGLLPEADNDFIFAIIGEELGLVGTLGVLALFAALALLMFRMIIRAEDPFVQITVGAISAWILGQAFVNMMVVAGLLPVLGVPLPFISSGGSALITSMIALGLLISFARQEPGAREAIGARIGRVRRSTSVMPAPARTRSTGSTRARSGGSNRARRRPGRSR